MNGRSCSNCSVCVFVLGIDRLKKFVLVGGIPWLKVNNTICDEQIAFRVALLKTTYFVLLYSNSAT